MSRFESYIQGTAQYDAAKEQAAHQERLRSFTSDLTALINKHSMENATGTPDFLLAEMLIHQLMTWNQFVQRRGSWRGESMELPALQELRHDSAMVDKLKQMIEDGVVHAPFDTDDLFREIMYYTPRKKLREKERESTEDEALMEGVDAPPSGETEGTNAAS